MEGTISSVGNGASQTKQHRGLLRRLLRLRLRWSEGRKGTERAFSGIDPPPLLQSAGSLILEPVIKKQEIEEQENRVTANEKMR